MHLMHAWLWILVKEGLLAWFVTNRREYTECRLEGNDQVEWQRYSSAEDHSREARHRWTIARSPQLQAAFFESDPMKPTNLMRLSRRSQWSGHLEVDT